MIPFEQLEPLSGSNAASASSLQNAASELQPLIGGHAASSSTAELSAAPGEPDHVSNPGSKSLGHYVYIPDKGKGLYQEDPSSDLVNLVKYASVASRNARGNVIWYC